MKHLKRWIIWSNGQRVDILNISWIYRRYIGDFPPKKWPKPCSTHACLVHSISPRYVDYKLIYRQYQYFIETSFNRLSMANFASPTTDIKYIGDISADISNFFILGFDTIYTILSIVAH